MVRRKSLVTGALILTGANLITRFMGFFYRIYMSRTIGAEGLGLYQLIMPLYMLAWTIAASGFTTTISKLTAQENAKGQYGNTRRLLKQATLICGLVGLVLGGALYLFAPAVALGILKDGRTLLSLRILGLAFPCMAMGSCIRGYFHGMQNNTVPALSQVLEQTVRIVTVFAIAPYFVPKGLETACCAAVVGIIFGEILSFLFVAALYFWDLRFIPRKKPAVSTLAATATILSMALPLTASRMAGSLLSTAENVLIPQRLALFDSASSSAMELYGKLTGMAMPLIQLPSALLMAVSITLVPAISEAIAIHHVRRIDYTVSKALLLTSVIAMGTAGFFIAFPAEICFAVYHQPDLGAIIWKLAVLCPFLYLQITLSGILNGLGRHAFLLRNNILSSFINIGFIYFLMPYHGVDAFIAGWLCSLIITVGLSLKKITQDAYVTIDLKNWFAKPIFAAVFSGIFARVAYDLMEPSVPGFLLVALLMAALYGIILMLSGCLDRETLSLLHIHRK